ncbi:hypothetical protein BC938DRAFT_472825 [Jimgerdemannia flammicorona]|uniref:Uncharacterized protein n=1 Tax=Jimgerdemannia flammicorona TaxID=994334 RepID=A0A433Q5A5_9FUNG|nr:hypothetical protein BC938DRAFT_472825 [Jimgerdemannia flammicorona]
MGECVDWVYHHASSAVRCRRVRNFALAHKSLPIVEKSSDGGGMVGIDDRDDSGGFGDARDGSEQKYCRLEGTKEDPRTSQEKIADGAIAEIEFLVSAFQNLIVEQNKKPTDSFFLLFGGTLSPALAINTD